MKIFWKVGVSHFRCKVLNISMCTDIGIHEEESQISRAYCIHLYTQVQTLNIDKCKKSPKNLFLHLGDIFISLIERVVPDVFRVLDWFLVIVEIREDYRTIAHS